MRRWKAVSMTDYRRGDIVLVNFNPQKRAEEVAKVRPAIIVSDSKLNEVMDLISVVALTSNLIDNAEPLRIRITKRDRLEVDSDAMVEQLRAVSKQRIGEKIAVLTEGEMEKIAYGIREMLVL
jgi:mRNA interferase MazF